MASSFLNIPLSNCPHYCLLMRIARSGSARFLSEEMRHMWLEYTMFQIVVDEVVFQKNYVTGNRQTLLFKVLPIFYTTIDRTNYTC